MALLKEQSIPPELAEAYAKTLGATRPNANPGGGDPDFTDMAVGMYPRHIEPPHIPTVKQLRQREYFQDVFACFNLAPDNERRAYWRLSRAGPIPYYNDYMRINIPLRIEGQTCPMWALPKARSYKSELGADYAALNWTLTDEDEHIISLLLELDHAEHPEYPPEWSELPYALLHTWWDFTAIPYTVHHDLLAEWDPPARAEYEEGFSIPEIPEQGELLNRYVSFYRFSATHGEAVVWDYDIDDPGSELSMWDFD